MSALSKLEAPAFNPEDIQGNIVRGYSIHHVRYLMLEITDREAARRFLGSSISGDDAGVPIIQRETEWAERPSVCFNMSLTFDGLKAFGVDQKHLASFPLEFREGMPARALKIGDFGESAPDKWPAPFDQPSRIHLIASIYSDQKSELDKVEAQLAETFNILGVRNGRDLAKSEVIFGYVDSISQPKFKHVHDKTQNENDELLDPLGTILLGYPTRMENVRFRVPQPPELGFNGSFNAFRVLAQDAAGFEAYLSETADDLLNHPDVGDLLPKGGASKVGKGLSRKEALREIVAAQIVGRWRNGVPYETSPDTMYPDPPVSLTNFDYNHNSPCPVGAHMRRCNPRGGPIVQRVANHTRRIVRRGMSYGPDFNPEKPDNHERGLLGNFLGANLSAQFEAIMYDWLNLGLQHPDITGSNDPLLGANAVETSWFDLRTGNGGSIRIRGLPRFVNCRGGAYTFLPSIRAIRYLSELKD